MKIKGLVILMLLAVSAVAQAGSLADGVRECSTIENDAARLTCFDGLMVEEGATVTQAPDAPEPVVDVAAAPTAADTIGAETLRRKDRAAEAEEEISVSTTLTRCTERSDGRYVFYFSNGQVWRQSKNDRVRFRDCNFDVTITKDFFGYKMQEDGEKRRIRIKRVK